MPSLSRTQVIAIQDRPVEVRHLRNNKLLGWTVRGFLGSDHFFPAQKWVYDSYYQRVWKGTPEEFPEMCREADRREVGEAPMVWLPKGVDLRENFC